MSGFGEEISNVIWTAVHETPAVDVRTFINPGDLTGENRSGIDALLTSPPLLAEFFRRRGLGRTDGETESGGAHDAYVKSLTPDELSDIVWRQLFVEHPPLSEATRTVLTTFGLLGLDVASGDLRTLRRQYEERPEAMRLERVLALANLDMVLYPVEAPPDGDGAKPPPTPPSFRPVLSLNNLLGDWKESARKLRLQGYGVKGKVDEFAPLELRRFLGGELTRLSPAALSLDWPVGHHPRDEGVGRLVREAALPLCRERGLPFFVGAGRDSLTDGYDLAIDMETLSALWEDCPEVRFLLFPTREEQLFPASRAAERCRNLLLCGPDQSLSYPLCLEHFIRRRLETSGSAFHACHSGADAPEALAGRWAHMRWTMGEALLKRYAELARTGWTIDADAVRHDVKAMLGGNARAFMGI